MQRIDRASRITGGEIDVHASLDLERFRDSCFVIDVQGSLQPVMWELAQLLTETDVTHRALVFPVVVDDGKKSASQDAFSAG